LKEQAAVGGKPRPNARFFGINLSNIEVLKVGREVLSLKYGIVRDCSGQFGTTLPFPSIFPLFGEQTNKNGNPA